MRIVGGALGPSFALLWLVLAAGLASAATPTPTPTAARPPLGKPAVKCQAAIEKAALTFVKKKLQSLSQCVSSISKCIQSTDGAAEQHTCLAKTGRACAGSGGRFERIGAEAAKLVASIRAACEVKGLAPGDLRRSDGLGFDAVARECASVTTIAGIADCVAAQHACRAEQIFEVQEPRARELIAKSTAAAGLSPPDLPCLHDLGDGGSLGLPKGAGELVLQCEATITKAGTRFVAAKSKSLAKCIDTIFACVETKAGAERQTCLDGKATAICAKEIGKIRSAASALAPSLDKKCLRDGGFYATGLAPLNGANLAAPTVECAGVGAGPGTYAGYQQCLAGQHEARVDELVRLAVPRADELLALVGCTLDGLECVRSGIGRLVTFEPPPVQDLAAIGAPRLPDGRFFVFGTPDASLTVDTTLAGPEIGRASCRERVYVLV